jgi:hypothetical protein
VSNGCRLTEGQWSAQADFLPLKLLVCVVPTPFYGGCVPVAQEGAFVYLTATLPQFFKQDSLFFTRQQLELMASTRPLLDTIIVSLDAQEVMTIEEHFF